MERELVGLLGAGLASIATGYGVVAPVGAIDAGFTLIDVISRESGPRVGAMINAMVQTLWLDWQQMGLDRTVLAQHAGALPAIIELNRPPPDAFGAARNSDDGSRMLAVLLIERARHSGDIARAGLDEGVAYALIDRLYATILASKATLPELMSAVDLVLQSDLWRPETEADGPSQPALPEPKLMARLSPAALTAIKAIISQTGASESEVSAKAEEHTRLLTELIERVAAFAHRRTEIAPPLVDAARLLAAGEFAAADKALASAERIATHRATANLASARDMMHVACEVLENRAALAEALADERKAARCYHTATRCLTSADGSMIWMLRLRQVEALIRLDKATRDDAAFADAARALADACMLDRKQVGIEAWAAAQLKLSAMYVELGKRSGKLDDTMKSVAPAEAALRAYTDIGATSGVADAQFSLGRQIWLAGDRANHPDVIERAASLLLESLAASPREADPARWVETSALLGQALLRLATLRGQSQLLSAAIGHLRGAAQFAATCNLPIDVIATETALARALLAEFAAGGEPLSLDFAATAFRRALKSATIARETATCAALRHELGMTLWAVADQSGTRGAYDAAIETLEASIAAYESIERPADAHSVKSDLGKLKASIAAAASTTSNRSNMNAS